jgi:hypothetical protein
MLKGIHPLLTCDLRPCGNILRVKAVVNRYEAAP